MRIDVLRQALGEAGLEAALVTGPTQIGYLTSAFVFPHERFFALYVPVAGESVVFGPALERGRLGGIGVPFVAVEDGTSPYEVLAGRIAQGGRLGVERGHMTLAWALDVAKAAGTSVESLGDISGLLAGLRVFKDAGEADDLRESARRLDRATAYAKSLIRPGVTERQMAAAIETFMRDELGGEPGFDSIVLFGERSALPHGSPTDRALREGEIVLVDIGLRYRGYVSDTTRTFFLGKPQPEIERIYAVVAEAARRGREAAGPGVPMGDLDAAARKHIAGQGYGERFTHRVGHGLGLEAHEEPYLLPGRQDLLKPGMCLTIEPGVYVSGLGGVRIEDDILVTEDGAEVLTSFPRDLQVVGP